MIHPNKLDHPGFRHIFYTSPNKKKTQKESILGSAQSSQRTYARRFYLEERGKAKN